MFFLDGKSQSEKATSLVVHAQDVHEKAKLKIQFQRTLRIPDDNQKYPLPPGLGAFPLEYVDDYRDKIPTSWEEHGGIFLPMFQAEALWLNFNSIHLSLGDYPFAIKIATGKINAVNGDPWCNELVDSDDDQSQDYVVVPGQMWLDGYSVDEGLVRQFVAMPLGQGYTAEEQLTGKAEHGGIQIIAYPMKKACYEELMEKQKEQNERYMADFNLRGQLDSILSHQWPVLACASFSDSPDFACLKVADEFGLAPGGLMRQEIFKDDHGYSVWDQDQPSRCFIHILNSDQYEAVTGKKPPFEPTSAAEYTEHGLPWFEYYSETGTALGGSDKLAQMDSIATKGIKEGKTPLPENKPVNPKIVVKLGHKVRKFVREGVF